MPKAEKTEKPSEVINYKLSKLSNPFLRDLIKKDVTDWTLQGWVVLQDINSNEGAAFYREKESAETYQKENSGVIQKVINDTTE